MSRGNSGSRFEATADLSELLSIAEDTILACLRERYLADKPYTAIGSSALVSLNPFKHLEINDDTTLQLYAQEYRHVGDDDSSLGHENDRHERRLPPHVFGLANNAYYHMKRTGQDQSIVINGETGAGKSAMRRLSIKSIIELSLSNAGKKGAKLGSQIPSAEYILESFGSARTHQNANASRFGKYTELQFSTRGRLAGAKTLAYYLEKPRVSAPPTGERNFHVFYYLVAGASPEERNHLLLDENTQYRYLGTKSPFDRRGAEASDEDELRFHQLQAAFKAVGLSKRNVAQVCQLVAAILHLGNIEFVYDKGRNEDAAVVKNVDILQLVADFLGVRAEDLEGVFSYRSKMLKKELVTAFLDTDGAAANRDELANTLYSLLFTWITEHLNQKLCKDDFASFIGLLDFPGFQNLAGSVSKNNSLDQFCVNYANERMQNWILQRVFNGMTDEFAQEGLTGLSPPVAFFDNSECLRLMDNQPGGLIHITDDQARRAPKKTEHTMIEAYAKRWSNHASFKLSGMDRTGFPTFTVSHFTGPVTYSTEAFLEKDADVINPDFVSLLRGNPADEKQRNRRNVGQVIPGATESTGSSNPFVQGLFTNKAVATEVHPHDEETIVAAQQSVKPMRAPSMRRKGRGIARLASVGEEGDAEAAQGEESADVGGGNNEAPARGIRCVLGEFKSSMDVLYQALNETRTWYIFCLNPNDAHLPNQVETRGLRGQVRSFGMPELAKKLKHVYEVSMTHEEARERYAAELNGYGILHGGSSPPGESLKKLLAAKGWNEDDMAVGKFKVFLSQRAFHKLEDKLRLEDEDPRERERPVTVAYLSAGEHRPESEMFGARSADQPRKSDLYENPYMENTSQAALPLVAHQGYAETPASDAGDAYDDRKDLDYETDRYTRYGDTASFVGTEAYAPSKNMFSAVDQKDRGLAEKEVLNAPQDGETAEELKETPSRRRWRLLCGLLTFWIPGFLLSWLGKMKRPDVRQAWREKLAINIIIWFICGCAIFVIAVLGNLICPRQHVYNSGELAEHNYKDSPNSVYVAIRGEVFDLTSYAPSHLTVTQVVPTKSVMQFGGIDASSLFPVQVSALCDGVDGTVSPWVTLDSTNTTNVYSQYHDFRAYTNDSRPDWYFEQMVMLRYNYRLGFIGYTPKEIRSMASAGRAVAIYNGLVYELSTYIAQGGGGFKPPTGYQLPSGTDRQFMSDQVVSMFQQNSGKDVTKLLDDLSGTIGADVVSRQKTCLRNLFLIGKVDNRNSAQCQFSKYILLVLSIIMVAIIGFKFLAALHFGSSRAPEDHDKFVICQIPCYTEGEESLRKTIDSLARLRYDDKRKLLLVICDGNIVGAGNDRPTPRIVLDILGADPALDPEPLSFLSLGDGAKQHNMGKVYSGLYEVAGHVVPYMVLVKIGKPSERQRPGNRGKRDSQMVVMHFLNKVHFDSPMNPLELEMYHQIKNVIGVNPTFYEYLFTVDADTTVEELALNRLVSAMVHDKKIIGACGETELANPKQSLITMMQVYEYFISHHLTKSFESLFGSITCLPGCFTIYRLRAPDTHKPLFVSQQIIHEYQENRVDTLHMKNLLHLGEDRYLTTLILKHFPTHKTKFVRDAHAFTVAPDDWKVLLSQRRRWINSTVHNLVELTTVEGLCGFCGFFGMRAIVFIDLLSTIIAPVTVAYLGYLLYVIIHQGGTIPTLSIIMLAAIYGLQALIFIFRLRWDMIAWMFFYILAIPIFSFFLPLYSFWYMDNFAWGNTRVVLGESGKKVVIHDEGKFDPRSIPEKSWREYENELWDNDNDNHSIGSWVPEKQPFADSRAPSFYGQRTDYAPSHISPSASQANLRGMAGMHSRSPSGYGFAPSGYADDARSMAAPSMYGGAGSMHMGTQGYDQASIYSGHPAQRDAYNHQDYLGAQYPMPGGNGTPTGAFPSSRPSSRFLPDNSPGGGDVTDGQLEVEIRNICLADGTDLETLTKKSVRRDLEKRFGTDLTSRKDFINKTIEKVLTGA